ncbi:hypothetical protein BDV93DRAFT_546613 [Ceratobasidium sp. AG-I]|nr:hypothetical protein BDV93DRAFT_546613 [Ceratobasidium sp. AG-I]
MRFTFALLAIPALVAAAPTGKRCTGTIASLNDVAAAQKCTTININAFTVPAGKTFALSLISGTTVNMLGDVKFGVANWAGPLFSVSGTKIVFNGNGHTFDGQGPSYWDGLGGNGGVTKPHPMMKIKMSGTYTNVKVLNSPAHTYSVSNPAALVMSKLTIDNSAGNAKNSKSGGKAAGHNTDGFDVSTTDLTIEDSTISNQDDCLALNHTVDPNPPDFPGLEPGLAESRLEDRVSATCGNLMKHIATARLELHYGIVSGPYLWYNREFGNATGRTQRWLYPGGIVKAEGYISKSLSTTCVMWCATSPASPIPFHSNNTVHKPPNVPCSHHITKRYVPPSSATSPQAGSKTIDVVYSSRSGDKQRRSPNNKIEDVIRPAPRQSAHEAGDAIKKSSWRRLTHVQQVHQLCTSLLPVASQVSYATIVHKAFISRAHQTYNVTQTDSQIGQSRSQPPPEYPDQGVPQCQGTNIIFQRNTCTGGHGISIGSVSTGAAVKNVQILNNKIINNDQALRIKTKSDATSASVTGVTFSGNTATGTKKYGIVVDQSYPSTLGTAGNNVAMSVLTSGWQSIAFTGNNNIAVADGAQRVAVNCGKGCAGTWDWTGLTVTGGKASKIYNYKGIKSGKY